MSTPAATDFESLRAQAVRYAQDASGNIWTDFNLHDPGVTLLEQTCFALSEIGYQAAHPIRDLLTADDGKLHYPDLALYDPRLVLPGDPVTDLDLTSFLSDLPGVSRAWAMPGFETGLYNAVVIPAEQDDLDEEALHDEVAAAFAAIRPLATDLDQITIARQRDTVLSCKLHITPTANPERVAARFYYYVAAILRGRTFQTDDSHAATRDDVYQTPELFYHPPAETTQTLPDIDAHLARLRMIPGIVDIGALSFRELPLPEAETSLKHSFPALVLPHAADEIELELWIGDNRLSLDHNRIHEEYIRVAAENIARAHHHLADADWSVLKDGRRRSFRRAHVDDMLPAIYRIYGANAPQETAVRGTQPPIPRQDTHFSQYRSAINTHLQTMSDALAAIPQLFNAARDLGTGDAALHEQRIGILDLLLALHGEAMPVIRHTGLHFYRGVAARQDFELFWRLQYLRALPVLNAARGTGPNGSQPGGFMARLGLLADISVETQTPVSDRMTTLGWRLQEDISEIAPGFPRRDLLLPVNPFEMMVPRDERAMPLDDAAFDNATPWMQEGVMTPALFRRAADPDAFAMTPVSGGRWQIVFDSGHKDALFAVKTAADKAEASDFVNRLRASWRALHLDAEVAYLVEDVMVRGSDGQFAANHGTLVLTGWTARTSLESYRKYVAELVQQLAPAHIVITLCWLNQSDLATFETLRAQALRSDPGATAALKTFLRDTGAAG
ncbi:hypothetical protein KX928_02500 [Roseobacter sp. YSTF-M11]|uniref:Uncharacterized protein n=1 Tax=Roseobacter insulae TaxID=2859783 RepID=A0A9X1K0N0_9RHOB|nr:hypothetical protein [Roseobacter insulae]MBW4706648.1 hypothetical protein [Roseobacter insulae]